MFIDGLYDNNGAYIEPEKAARMVLSGYKTGSLLMISCHGNIPIKDNENNYEKMKLKVVTLGDALQFVIRRMQAMSRDDDYAPPPWTLGEDGDNLYMALKLRLNKIRDNIEKDFPTCQRVSCNIDPLVDKYDE
jgi:hypothetical protein